MIFEKIDINASFLCLLSLILFIWVIYFVLIKYLLPLLSRYVERDYVEYLIPRNFLILRELILESDKLILDRYHQEAVKLHSRTAKYYLFISFLIISIINTIDFLGIYNLTNKDFFNLIVTAFLASILYTIYFMNRKTRLEYSWEKLLNKKGYTFRIGIQDVLLSRSHVKCYSFARHYLNSIYQKELSKKFYERMEYLVRTYQKSELDLEKLNKQVFKFEKQHLWYDRNVVFGLSDENQRVPMLILIIGSYIIFSAYIFSLLYLQSSITTMWGDFIIAFLIIIFGIVIQEVYDVKFNTPILTQDEMKHLLKANNVVYSEQNLYQDAKALIENRLNSLSLT